MFDPYDSPTYRMLQQIQKDQDYIDKMYGSLSAFDRLKIEQETAAALFPHISAFERFTTAQQSRDVDAIRQMIRDRGSLSPFDRTLIDLMADEVALEVARERSLGSSFHVIESLTHAHKIAAAAEQGSAFSALARGLREMQDAAADALSMRAVIDAHMSGNKPRGPYEDVLSGLALVTDQANRVWRDFAEAPSTLLATPPQLRSLPTTQLALATRSTGLLITGDSEFVEPNGLLEAGASDLEDQLSDVDPDLAPLYRGALSMFHAGGEDYIRHVSVSLRELFVFLFKRLGPEEDIRAWDPSVIPAKGGVSYKASLQYIFRALAASNAYAEMTKRDIEHVLQCFFALNEEGVHKLTPDLAREELRLLVIRCEYSLLSVMFAHRMATAQS